MSLEMSPCHLESASEPPLINRLRPYQREVALAILTIASRWKGGLWVSNPTVAPSTSFRTFP